MSDDRKPVSAREVFNVADQVINLITAAGLYDDAGKIIASAQSAWNAKLCGQSDQELAKKLLVAYVKEMDG